ATGLLVGTPAYLAPELWHGAPADERSDIYALGVTLHYLLTGRAPVEPWRAGAASPSRVATSDAARITGVSDAMWTVIERCTVPDPADRIASAHDLRQALLAAGYADTGSWTQDDAEAFWRQADRDLFG
ncbi:MAG: protein kinase, partial [Synechococcaceae cyanobacterium]|nr:protein kinase [Synechococcaceae cyanobacterium]